jgi:hypothetical protein
MPRRYVHHVRKEFGKANITTLVERVSRFTGALTNNDQHQI